MTNHSQPTSLSIYQTKVKPEWIDYNDHMNDGYYVVAFTVATDAVQDHIGLDEAYRKSTNCTLYTVEAHVTYLREVKVDTNLRFESYVLGVDTKRLHLFHTMINADEEYVAATHELMLLHVDQTIGRTAPMPEDMLARTQLLRNEHAQLDLPDQVGSRIQWKS